MKKILVIMLLIILPDSKVDAGVYTKCFFEQITHPLLKSFERKSFSQMKSFPSIEDYFIRNMRYYIPGVNKVFNENEITNFKDITFDLREDNTILSTFNVGFQEYRASISLDDKLETDSNTSKIDQFKTFRSKYKIINNSKEYNEYEPENPIWNSKIILNKKDNIIEIKTRILFLDTPYRRDAINDEYWRLKANNFTDGSGDFDYSNLKTVKNSNFSIFFKCKFLKKNKKGSTFDLNNIYTLLIAGFLALSGIMFFFWRFFKKNEGR
ncbi:MAG: hypothetical protein P8O81_03390 [Flavobacteriaceae bacterium]|nr:hypothetical protein [Flavobacteriaceae bacterium]